MNRAVGMGTLRMKSMDNDMKWYALVMIVIITIPMVDMLMSEYQKNQCRVAAIQAAMPADQIERICK